MGVGPILSTITWTGPLFFPRQMWILAGQGCWLMGLIHVLVFRSQNPTASSPEGNKTPKCTKNAFCFGDFEVLICVTDLHPKSSSFGDTSTCVPRTGMGQKWK